MANCPPKPPPGPSSAPLGGHLAVRAAGARQLQMDTRKDPQVGRPYPTATLTTAGFAGRAAGGLQTRRGGVRQGPALARALGLHRGEVLHHSGSGHALGHANCNESATELRRGGALGGVPRGLAMVEHELLRVAFNQWAGGWQRFVETSRMAGVSAGLDADTCMTSQRLVWCRLCNQK